MPLIRTPSNPDSFLELKILAINRELSGVGNPDGFALFLFALLLNLDYALNFGFGRIFAS